MNPDYRRLPEAPRLEDTIAEIDTRAVPDPNGGIDPQQLFLIRNSAG